MRGQDCKYNTDTSGPPPQESALLRLAERQAGREGELAAARRKVVELEMELGDLQKEVELRQEQEAHLKEVGVHCSCPPLFAPCYFICSILAPSFCPLLFFRRGGRDAHLVFGLETCNGYLIDCFICSRVPSVCFENVRWEGSNTIRQHSKAHVRNTLVIFLAFSCKLSLAGK